MKNRIWKRLFAAGLAVTMIAGMGLAAFAADNVTIDTTRNGSITVHKYEGKPLCSGGYDSQKDIADAVASADELVPEAGIVFRYLKVGDVLQYTKYEGTADNVTKIGYSLDAKTEKLLGLESDDVDYTAEGVDYYTASVLDEKLDTFLANGEAVKTSIEQLLSQSTSFPATDDHGTATVSSLPLGLYLISEYNYPAETTGTTEPFFVSLPMTDVDMNGNAVWIYDVNVYPKNQLETPEIDKVIVGNDGNETKELDVQVDDSTMFRIRADVPNYVGKLKTFKITDTLSEGLAYDKASYVVYGVDTEKQIRKKLMNGNEYYFTQDGQKLEWTFQNANISATDTKIHLYDVIEIEYSATLTKLAVVGEPNTNAASMTYSTTTNLDAQDDPTETVTVTEIPGVYTYAVDLYKYGDSDEGNPLKNVTFELQDGEGNPMAASEQEDGTVGVYYIDKDGTAVITTGNDGHIYIKGLEAGTYYLKETNTNQGFHLLKNKIEITITSNEDTYTESETGTYVLADPAWNYKKGADRNYSSGELFLLPDMEKPAYISFNTTIVTSEEGSVVMYEPERLAWDSNYAMGEKGTADAGVVKLYVNNTKIFQLPMTGGNGTLLFVVAGAVIAMAGCGILFCTHRKRKPRL